MDYERWDVVAVPFPFSDRPGEKRRPALVLSSAMFNRAGHAVLAMITTIGKAPWPGDTVIDDLAAAGLPRPCMVRLKLFTLDARLLRNHLGALAPSDTRTVEGALRMFLP